MTENKIISYLRFVLQPWYGLHLTEKMVTIDHPLYNFQFKTTNNYTIEQAIMLIFRISYLKQYSQELLIISTIYMRKICILVCSKNKIKNVYTPTTITSVFFICILLASKYYMDDSVNNNDLHRLAFCNIIPLNVFNHLEVQLLELMDYNLYVSLEEYTLYENMLKGKN